MPRNGGQGQSLGTIYKERRIGSALSVCMRIAVSRFGGKGYQFWYLDSNAGSGMNDLVGVEGSPLVFYRQADQWLSTMPPQAFFAEIDENRVRQLWRRIQASNWRERSRLIPRDNEKALKIFGQCIEQHENPRHAVGAILVDPNGWFDRAKNGEGVPVEGLFEFVKKFPKIDLILNLNVRSYQLARTQQWGERLLSVRELMPKLRKRYWLLGRVQPPGSRFILMIGRNIETRPHTRLGLHLADSAEGREIIEWAEGHRQSNLPQLSLPRTRREG